MPKWPIQNMHQYEINMQQFSAFAAAKWVCILCIYMPEKMPIRTRISKTCKDETAPFADVEGSIFCNRDGWQQHWWNNSTRQLRLGLHCKSVVLITLNIVITTLLLLWQVSTVGHFWIPWNAGDCNSVMLSVMILKLVLKNWTAC